MASTTARRALDGLLASLLLLLPAAFLHSNLKNPARVNGVDRVVLAVSAPIQRGVSWVIEGLGGVWSGYVWLVDVEDENVELRGENERLRRELAEAKRSAAETARLEDLVGLRQRVPAESRGARVVAAGMSPYFRVTRVTLDRGEGEVKPGMPVLAPEGAVGRVERVFGAYADVRLAVDPASSIDVLVPRTGSRGVLKGRGGENDYDCKVDYLLRSEEVKEGDLVVTSGLGGSFPRDLPVGRIRSIKKIEYGLYQEVIVEPAVDFSSLSSVLVVLAPPPPPDPSAKTRKPPERAFGAEPVR